MGSYDFSSGTVTFTVERGYNIGEKVLNNPMSLKLILNDVEYKDIFWLIGELNSSGKRGYGLLSDTFTIDFWDDGTIEVQTDEPFTMFGMSIVDKVHVKMPIEYLPVVPAEQVVLTSPGGKQFVIAVDDSGTLTATEVTV